MIIKCLPAFGVPLKCYLFNALNICFLSIYRPTSLFIHKQVFYLISIVD